MVGTGDTGRVRMGQVMLEPGQCHDLKQRRKRQRETQREREWERDYRACVRGK